MHPTSFFDFGEDDLLLIHIFSGLFLIFLFPWKRNLNSIIRFDDFPDPKRNNRMISFYKKCIQRHMLVFGAQKTYLSKGPGHTPKMRYLNFFFPDCRFHTTRPPNRLSFGNQFVCPLLRIIPYALSYEDLIRRTIAMADYWYPHPLEVFKDMEESRQVVINTEQ
jgi:hypothetical protein